MVEQEPFPLLGDYSWVQLCWVVRYAEEREWCDLLVRLYFSILARTKRESLNSADPLDLDCEFEHNGGWRILGILPGSKLRPSSEAGIGTITQRLGDGPPSPYSWNSPSLWQLPYPLVAKRLSQLLEMYNVVEPLRSKCEELILEASTGDIYRNRSGRFSNDFNELQAYLAVTKGWY